jgi:hypothetical protein
MPWALIEPKKSGDLDVVPYTEVKIISFFQDPNLHRIDLRLEYGNTVEGTWVPGYLPVGKKDHANIYAADYASLVSGSVPDVQTEDPGDPDRYAQVGNIWVERTYHATKRALYEWLAVNEVIEPGAMA